jgi:hypothetical protein
VRPRRSENKNSSQANQVAAGELVGEWARHADGESFVRGPGGASYVNGLDDETQKAKTTVAIGNEHMLRDLLRDEFAGTRNSAGCLRADGVKTQADCHQAPRGGHLAQAKHQAAVTVIAELSAQLRSADERTATVTAIQTSRSHHVGIWDRDLNQRSALTRSAPIETSDTCTPITNEFRSLP